MKRKIYQNKQGQAVKGETQVRKRKAEHIFSQLGHCFLEFFRRREGVQGGRLL